MELLDMKCAGCGEAIVADLHGLKEAAVNRALGILQEEGVYAFFLYLKAEDKDTKALGQKVFAFLLEREGLKEILSAEKDDLKAVRDGLAGDLDALLLARELIERVLVYTRYHLKAKGKPQ